MVTCDKNDVLAFSGPGLALISERCGTKETLRNVHEEKGNQNVEDGFHKEDNVVWIE